MMKHLLRVHPDKFPDQFIIGSGSGSRSGSGSNAEDGNDSNGESDGNESNQSNGDDDGDQESGDITMKSNGVGVNLPDLDAIEVDGLSDEEPKQQNSQKEDSETKSYKSTNKQWISSKRDERPLQSTKSLEGPHILPMMSADLDDYFGLFYKEEVDCKHCDKHFSRFLEYKQHLKRHFERNKGWKWRHCHEPGCDPEKTYSCLIPHLCGSHQYPYPFVCVVPSEVDGMTCDFTASSKYRMMQHLQKIHRELFITREEYDRLYPKESDEDENDESADSEHSMHSDQSGDSRDSDVSDRSSSMKSSHSNSANPLKIEGTKQMKQMKQEMKRLEPQKLTAESKEDVHHHDSDRSVSTVTDEDEENTDSNSTTTTNQEDATDQKVIRYTGIEPFRNVYYKESAKCKLCGAQFDDFGGYRAHLKQHFDNDPRKRWNRCFVAGCDPRKKYKNFIAHLCLLHQYDYPYHCILERECGVSCDFAASAPKRMMKHLTKMHGIDEKQFETKTVLSSSGADNEHNEMEQHEDDQDIEDTVSMEVDEEEQSEGLKEERNGELTQSSPQKMKVPVKMEEKKQKGSRSKKAISSSNESDAELPIHIVNVHYMESADCKLCGKHFDSYISYREHLKRHFEEDPNKKWKRCHEVGCDPKRTVDLAHFCASHQYDYPYHCLMKMDDGKTCPFSAATHFNMRKHLEGKHKIIKPSPRVEKVTKVTLKKITPKKVQEPVPTLESFD